MRSPTNLTFKMPGGNQTRLASLIKKACNPHNVEPDIQVALEVCELVNSKTSYAHLACTEVSNYFKVEDEIQCLLALFLLDMLVINCGYPVHLSISKREFLNKLMYRFPPGPQVNYNN